ncbi:MAG: BamA/TamA family outer membrane protein [Candidatus Marinimicrobia bacterium]|nr:BamA/TamA family outer membrane protein [Candidatus Neomarinimicrobiota bacterium]
MKVEKDWSLFRQGEDFRDNPLIQEGEYKNTYLSVELGNSRKLKNWSASLDVEWNSDLISDNMPDYERYIISLSKYQRLGRNDEVNFRVRYGTTFGTVPDQKKFDLGGIGTLRGYGYKEFQNGEKMILINTEYITDGDAITGLEFLPIFNDFEVAFFADAGIVWNGARDLPNSSELKRNIGIGLQSDDGDFRINFAKPLDGPKDEREIVITFRINHMF